MMLRDGGGKLLLLLLILKKFVPCFVFCVLLFPLFSSAAKIGHIDLLAILLCATLFLAENPDERRIFKIQPGDDEISLFLIPVFMIQD